MNIDGKENPDSGGPVVNRRFSLIKKNVSLTSVILIVLLALAGGFVLGTRADQLATRFPILSKIGGNPQQLDLQGVQNTYNVLKDNFDGELDTAKLIEGAMRGLVDAAGDPYTTYLSDDEAEKFMEDLEDQFSGIGAELDKRDSRIIIRSTLDDSPARKSGLQASDVIVKVNDQDSTDWTIDEAVSEIRGEKGTSVKLTVLRGDSEIKEFSIVRDIINNPSVKTEYTKDNIGIMRISRFGETNTHALARKAAQEFKDKKVKGVIVDLRGNGGGYLEAAEAIAGIWLNDKVVVTERRGNQVIDTLKSEQNALLEGVPTVVLIDGGSASASEIVAGALRDHNAAKLVGVKSFGKGSVQKFENVPDFGQIKVTFASWFTPNGRNINKEGIDPDVEVKLSQADLDADRDLQKDKAIELLNQE